MLEEVVHYAKWNHNLKKVYFILYTEETFNIFSEIVTERFVRTMEKLTNNPIPTVDIIIDNGEGIV